MSSRYPDGMLDWVKDHYMEYTNAEMAELINEKYGLHMTRSSVNSMKQNYGLRGGPRSQNRLHYSDLFPKEEAEYILEHYKGTGHADMAALLLQEFGHEHTKQQVKTFYANHHLNSGLTGRYEPGHVPENKGKPMPESVRKSLEPHMFQTGHRPKNAKEVGTEIIDENGYRKIKVAEPNKWEYCHRLLWQQEHGPIPRGMVVTFKDGDKTNITLDNLMLIGNDVNGLMNHAGMRSENGDITESAAHLARLKLQISRKEKEIHMGKKNKAVTLSRNKYMELKKMDHSSLEDYMNDIYEQGRAAGSREAADPFDLEKAMELITHTRGVGPSKLKLIREALVEAGAKEEDHDGE